MLIAARTASFEVVAVFIPAARARIWSSTYAANRLTYSSSASPLIAYRCPQISTSIVLIKRHLLGFFETIEEVQFVQDLFNPRFHVSPLFFPTSAQFFLLHRPFTHSTQFALQRDVRP